MNGFILADPRVNDETKITVYWEALPGGLREVGVRTLRGNLTEIVRAIRQAALDYPGSKVLIVTNGFGEAVRQEYFGPEAA